MATVKIKPSHESQGDYVVIEEENFNKDIHALYEEEKKEVKPRQKRNTKKTEE